MENGCGGGSPWTFTHNYLHDCLIDCDGGDYAGTGTVNFNKNFADINNVTDFSSGDLLCMVENIVHPSMTVFHTDNNYILNGGNGGSACCGGYALSIIDGKQTVRYNYIAGHQTFIEFSPHAGESASNIINVEDNYLDWLNIQNLGVHQNEGTGDTGTDCNSNTLLRNREIPNLNDSCQPSGNYIAGPTNNIGIPPPFSSGASS
jgi:hypothetical protein